WDLLLRSFRYVFRSSCKEEFDKNLRVKKNSQINYWEWFLNAPVFLPEWCFLKPDFNCSLTCWFFPLTIQ
uniref:Uncharacterized protein n=1 Tax=Triticum urartu TaxID=4572 RepID=A0A8R7QBV2_TRIUA